MDGFFAFIPQKLSHTFLINLVRKLEPKLSEIESVWEEKTLEAYTFVHFLTPFVFKGTLPDTFGEKYKPIVEDEKAEEEKSISKSQAPNTTNVKTEPQNGEETEEKKQNGLEGEKGGNGEEQDVGYEKKKVTIPTDILFPDGTTKSYWERRLFTIHNDVMSIKGKTAESFDHVDKLAYCLFGVYVAIAAEKKLKAITFIDFRAFILNITIGGKKGIDENDVKPMTLTRTVPCRDLYHVNRIEIIDDLNIIVAAIQREYDQPACLRVLDMQTLAVLDEKWLTYNQGNVLGFDVVNVATNLSSSKIRMILACTQDSFVRAYDISKLRSMKAQVQFEYPQSVCKYIRRRNLVCFGSVKGMLTVITTKGMERYTINYEPATSFTILNQLMVHEESITALETDLFCESIFTASLDRTVVQIWTKDFTVARRMTGHKLGILSMAYNQHYNTIVTCGMEFQIYCWTLEVWNVKPMKMEDPGRPYTQVISQVRTVPSKPICISMDIKGLIKVWDLRTLRCISSGACEPERTRVELEPLSWIWFAVNSKSLEVLAACNRKCYVFEYDVDDKALGPYCAHEGSITAAGFDPRTRTILSTAKSEIQTWNIETAQSITRLREMTSSRISGVLVLPDLGAFLLATSTGQLQVHSTASFSVLCQWVHQSGQEVISLCTVPKRTAIVGIAISGHAEIVNIDTEIWQMNGIIFTRKDLPIHASACQQFKALGLPYVLIGEQDNAVSIWNCQNVNEPIEVAKAVNTPVDRSINCIAAVDHLPMFVAADDRGWFHCWAANTTHTWWLGKWKNKKPESIEVKDTPIVKRMVIVSSLMLLFTGDDYGYINVWDISYCLGSTELHQRVQRLTVKDVPSVQKPRGLLLPPCITSWEAHPESAISELVLIPSPFVLLSGGVDCRMQLFSLGGTHLSFLIMKKIGVQDLDPQKGVELVNDVERYNDLEPPYGRGVIYNDPRSNQQDVALSEIASGAFDEVPLLTSPLSNSGKEKSSSQLHKSKSKSTKSFFFNKKQQRENSVAFLHAEDSFVCHSPLRSDPSLILGKVTSMGDISLLNKKTGSLYKLPPRSNSSSCLKGKKKIAGLGGSLAESDDDEEDEEDDSRKLNGYFIRHISQRLKEAGLSTLKRRSTLPKLQLNAVTSVPVKEGINTSISEQSDFCPTANAGENLNQDGETEESEYDFNRPQVLPKLEGLKQKIYERPSAIVLPSDEVLYGVPQYLSLDDVSHPEKRPGKCTYVPSEKIDHVFYGTGEKFKHFVDVASVRAYKSFSDIKEKQREVHQQAQEVALEQHKIQEWKGSGQQRGSPQRRDRSASPAKRAQSVPPMLEVHLGKEKFTGMANLIDPRGLISTTPPPQKITNSTNYYSSPSPGGGRLYKSTNKFKKLAPLANSPSPMNNRPRPLAKYVTSGSKVPRGGDQFSQAETTNTEGTSCYYDDEDEEEPSVFDPLNPGSLHQFPSDLIVPHVRGLQGNSHHVKSHKVKPF